MRVIVNDLSFQWRMYSQEEALEKLLNLIKICREIEGGRLKKVEKLVLVDKIDVQYEIAPSCSIIKLLQRVLPLEERRYLLSILLNRGTGGMVSGSPFVCGEKSSYACAAARKEAVVSLLSSVLFSDSVITGKIDDQPVVLKNIGKKEHFFAHREILGIRIYRANSEKHKKERSNFYGKGKVASPMDLDDEHAQRLLDKAIEFKGKLYGRYQGKNYSFQREQDVYYHGYIDDTLRDDVKTELDKYNWE